MKIFLTGGTGFIGSYVLCDALAAGHDVLALRRSVISRPLLPLAREPVWLQSDLLSLKQQDLAGCDVVVHLAFAGVSPQVVPWEQMVKVNVLGSAQLIAMADRAGVGRMVVSGTFREYGTTASHFEQIPVNAPLEPVCLYGASKVAGFHLLSTYAKAIGMKMFYARISNVYGDGQCEQNFWPSLKRAATLGEDFPMTSGEQVMDFIPVETVSRKILDSCSIPFASGQFQILEKISSGNPQSLLQFAEQEWKRFGATGKLLPGALTQRANEVVITESMNHLRSGAMKTAEL